MLVYSGLLLLPLARGGRLTVVQSATTASCQTHREDAKKAARMPYSRGDARCCLPAWVFRAAMLSGFSLLRLSPRPEPGEDARTAASSGHVPLMGPILTTALARGFGAAESRPEAHLLAEARKGRGPLRAAPQALAVEAPPAVVDFVVVRT